VLRDRLAAGRPAPTVVTPSRWLAAAARRSRLFREARIEVIPYSLDTEVFAPAPKAEAKRRLGLAPHTLTLLTGAHNGNERRKGFGVLVEALRICASDPAFGPLAQRGEIALLCLGQPPDGLEALPLPARPLGWVTAEERLRLAYSAADLFLLPSLEDNLPNTLLEAMSCGTPVVAFDVGGVPDVLEDHVTGRLVPAGDAARLAEAILDGLRDEGARRKMGEACRRTIEINHAMDVQARRYLDLYRDLLGGQMMTGAAAGTSTPVRPPPPSPADGGDIAGGVGESAALGVGDQPAPDAMASDETWPVAPDPSAGPALEPILRRWSRQVARSDFEELERARADVERLRERIRAMESTKFWKLRARWFRIRRAVGWPGRE
jgi:hypothetical protein